MTKTEIERIQNNVSASLKVEGKKASQEAIDINGKYLKGQLDSNTAIEMIKNLYINK